MIDPTVTAAHLRRTAAVYCRQSTLIQVERNRESTLRQYDLVSRAGALGWPHSAPARLTRSYWRKVDSRLRSTWIRVDWRQ